VAVFKGKIWNTYEKMMMTWKKYGTHMENIWNKYGRHDDDPKMGFPILRICGELKLGRDQKPGTLLFTSK